MAPLEWVCQEVPSGEVTFKLMRECQWTGIEKEKHSRRKDYRYKRTKGGHVDVKRGKVVKMGSEKKTGTILRKLCRPE